MISHFAALQFLLSEIRKGAVTAVHSAKSGHPGGSLSAADIYTYLFFEEMNVDPADPKKADRDRFVLSKGHTAPGYYATLANRGFFPVEDLTTLRKVGSYLQGHPDMKHIPSMLITWKLNASNFLSIGYGEFTSSIAPSI